MLSSPCIPTRAKRANPDRSQDMRYARSTKHQSFETCSSTTLNTQVQHRRFVFAVFCENIGVCHGPYLFGLKACGGGSKQSPRFCRTLPWNGAYHHNMLVNGLSLHLAVSFDQPSRCELESSTAPSRTRTVEKFRLRRSACFSTVRCPYTRTASGVTVNQWQRREWRAMLHQSEALEEDHPRA